MQRGLVTEIIHRGVANLANSPAIGGNPRLALNKFHLTISLSQNY